MEGKREKKRTHATGSFLVAWIGRWLKFLRWSLGYRGSSCLFQFLSRNRFIILWNDAVSANPPQCFLYLRIFLFITWLLECVQLQFISVRSSFFVNWVLHYFLFLLIFLKIIRYFFKFNIHRVSLSFFFTIEHYCRYSLCGKCINVHAKNISNVIFVLGNFNGDLSDEL